MGQHHCGMMGSAAPAPFPGGMRPRRRGMMMHTTFFWGSSAEVLFDGWPGRIGAAMYAASLAFVFLLAVLVEWLSACRLIKPGARPVVAGLLRTLMHTVHVGLAYLVMLAVMSFNGGVILAAVAGQALGFSKALEAFEKPDGEAPRGSSRLVTGWRGIRIFLL